ncbi:EAL domain-containing protein [Mesobaculum littorinae]|uniref:EAL domain-containing protein n=2 Tax=Mesobaculum littorinae TaxID=2486419 RepID=A0A438AHP6_9RHOB|nr:EAL domain-containing protein [Mesobaculum littorinae]
MPAPSPRRPQSPLNHALRSRDRDVIALVDRAVRDRNVMLAYQPVVPAGREDRPAFFEGLIRILDDNGRIIPARDFIGSIEMTELGRRMDCLALEAGLATLRDRPGLRLSVNMSARSIGYPAWQRMLNQGLDAHPGIGDRLILEISESSAMLMPDIVQVFICDLQARGVSFALDDFGAGAMAFHHLKSMWFDILKIDGSFVRGIVRSPENQAVVQSMTAIARHFDMISIASKVQSGDDARWLDMAGVDCLQGYYYGAPTIRPRWETDTQPAGATQPIAVPGSIVVPARVGNRFGPHPGPGRGGPLSPVRPVPEPARPHS